VVSGTCIVHANCELQAEERLTNKCSGARRQSLASSRRLLLFRDCFLDHVCWSSVPGRPLIFGVRRSRGVEALCNMLANPYFQNVASQFIGLALLALFGFVVYFATGRARLLKFFHIKNTKAVTVYLSNLSVPAGGARGVDGVPRSYAGPAIPLPEVHLIPAFQRLFNFLIPGAENLPGILKWLLISDIAVSVAASPVEEGEIDRCSTLITVGSPGFNRASRRVEQALHSLARFVEDNRALQLGDGPPVTDPRCAFVQRAVDQATCQVAFYVAGPASLGTTGAAYYLVSEWKRLSKRFPGSQPFCVMLRITSDDAKQYEVLFER
jgi:hypothetical protein